MFNVDYAALFQNIPPQLATFLIALIPIAELRVAIPVALGVYKLPIWQAIFFASIADIIIAALIIYFLGPIHKFLSGKFKRVDKFFDWLFKRTRRKFSGKYETWGNIGLMIFVGIPLPMTGSWTGSIAAWLFGMPKKRSLSYISLGVIISAGIVTLISLGVIKIF